MARETERESLHSKIEIFTMVNMRMIFITVLVLLIGKMAINMLVNILMEREMVME